MRYILEILSLVRLIEEMALAVSLLRLLRMHTGERAMKK